MASALDKVEMNYLSNALCILCERTQRATTAQEAKDFAEAVCSLSYARDSLFRIQTKSEED